MKYIAAICVILVYFVSVSPADVNQCSRVAHTSGRPVRSCSREYTIPYSQGSRQGDVLFVEDPGNAGFGPVTKPDPVWDSVLTEILGAGNYGWFGPTSNPSDDGPDLATMQGYDLVVWITYDYWFQDTAALTATDQDNLSQYMESGGCVWLIGQDALYSGVPASWMTIYFGLADANQDYISSDSVQLHGLAEINCITLLSIEDYQTNPFFPDELIPDAGAHAVLEEVDNAKVVGIFYDTGVWLSSFWTVDGRVQPVSSYWQDWIAMVTGMLDAFGVLGIVEIPHEVPAQHVRLNVAPSPMIHTAAIDYALDMAGDVSIDIFNTLGQHIATLFEGYREAGSYRVVWHGKDASGIDVPMGMYFVRFFCGQYSRSEHLIVLR